MNKPPKPYGKSIKTVVIAVLLLLAFTAIAFLFRFEHQNDLDYALLRAVENHENARIFELVGEGARGTVRENDSHIFTLSNRLKHINYLFKPSGNAKQEDRGNGLLMLYYSEESAPDERTALALLRSGAPVNDTYRGKDSLETGLSVLGLAVRFQEHDMVKELLIHGADPNFTKSEYGWAPLFGADPTDAETLLVHGANINAEDINGCTAFFQTNKGVAEVLLAHGADINQRDRSGETLMSQCCDTGDTDKIKWLLEHHASVKLSPNGKETIFPKACAICSVKTLQLLLKHGCTTSDRDDEGNTGLMFSIENSHDDVFPWLIKNHVDINAIGTDKNTALSVARFYLQFWDKDPRGQELREYIRILKSKGASDIKPTGDWPTNSS